MDTAQLLVRMATALFAAGIALTGLLLIFQAMLLSKYSELKDKGAPYRRLLLIGNLAIVFSLLTSLASALRIIGDFPWSAMFLPFLIACILVAALAYQAYRIATSD